jgi:hypothetical protein
MPTQTAQKVSLTQYRLELQGDRPIERSIIYSLLQNQTGARAGDTSPPTTPVDELFCRILLLRRALDTKAKFAETKVDDKIVPIPDNYTEQFARFLEDKKQSTVASDQLWSDHLSATLGSLLQKETQSPERTTEPNSDGEFLQLAQKLETTIKSEEEERKSGGEERKSGGRKPSDELALALLYAKMQRFEDVVATLDSMDLDTSDLWMREWIIANVAIRYAKKEERDSTLMKRGDEAAMRLLNFRLSDLYALNLVSILQHFDHPKEMQEILDRLTVSASDHRLLSELFYKMNAMGDSQKENTVKVAQRILLNPAFLQNARRLTQDVFLLEATIQTLQRHERLETVVPILEQRLRGLRDKTDSRILLVKLYLLLNRQEEAKALALELAQNPTAEPERRQMVVSYLTRFGLVKELEAMNRLLLERNDKPAP